ncbi:ABC transporter ATP-binding protein [Acidobacteria bacterium AH-259-G07]|nr:ABC transporter ATP-binding protein [Acidobacteria bacterium AH-259-G07]
MEEFSVKIEAVTKRFVEIVAVQHFTLDVKRGEFISLLGPSGCGKTTLLRIIAGLETSDQGRIVIEGEDMTGQTPEKRPVNMVFQRYALFPHMNVFNNIAFSQVLKKRPRQEIQAKVSEMLALVDLDGYQNRNVNELSGGQSQRVALARSLINQPKVLLLDEPLGALDLLIRKQMQLELKRIQRHLNTTFIYVTHDQEEAMILSNRIVLMNKGEIVQVGKPEDLYRLPETVFAAHFIGETNLLEGNVTRINAKGMEVEVGGLRIKTRLHPKVKVGMQVWLSIRPEKIDLAADQPDDPPNRVNHRNDLPAIVKTRTFLGSSMNYEARLGNQRLMNLVTSAEAVSYQPRDKVRISWAKEDTVVLID